MLRTLPRVLHDLRHRRVTTWLAAGGDAVKVKEAMGQADLRTTMGYTHLVITDVVMPGTSGPQLVDRLRVEHRKLPVLFISGHPLSDVPGQAPVIPGEHFVQKPFTPESLVAGVAQVLRRH